MNVTCWASPCSARDGRVTRGDLLEEVGSGGITGDATEDDASEERGTAETVGTVHATCHLTRSEEAGNGGVVGLEHLRSVVDAHTAPAHAHQQSLNGTRRIRKLTWCSGEPGS